MPMSVVYTTVNGQILCENRGGVVSHFVSDPLGSVVMVRDNAGNTVYEAEYDPYGNVQSETGTNPSEFGYVGTLGYVKDSAFSLYVRARYLLTNLGRWLTKDPLWPNEPGFVYAGAAPSMLVDPNGKKCGGPNVDCCGITPEGRKECDEKCKKIGGKVFIYICWKVADVSYIIGHYDICAEHCVCVTFKRRWHCDATCPYYGPMPCSINMTGSGSGDTRSEACTAAKKSCPDRRIVGKDICKRGHQDCYNCRRE